MVKNSTDSHRWKFAVILTLALFMAFVYPAHLIVDHSGIFHQKSNHSQNENTQPDDELCPFCLNIFSMEMSDIVTQVYSGITEFYFPDRDLFRNRQQNVTIDARATPSHLLILA